MDSKRCVIVGAGMAGLTAGRALQEQGWSVTLLDKGRGAGGRMATRRSDWGRVDHGAQFLTVRDEAFAQTVAAWEKAGVARRWFTQDGHDRWVGTEGMSSITRHLAAGLDVQTGVQVTRVEWSGGQWALRDAAGSAWESPAVILTAPVPQSLALLGAAAPAALSGVEYAMCLALLVWLEGESAVPAPGYAKPDSGAVAWVADNRQKGICAGPGAALTLHATPEWSRAHWDLPKEESGALLLREAAPWLASGVREWALHKWKFAMPLGTESEACLALRQPGPLVFAGDAFGGPRVEGAWLSGRAAARQIVAAP